MHHTVPVIGVKRKLADVKPVSCRLDLLKAGRLAGCKSQIFTKQHGVGAEDLVPDRVRFTASLDFGVHHAVKQFLCRVAFFKADRSFIKIPVDPWMRHFALAASLSAQRDEMAKVFPIWANMLPTPCSVG